MAKMAERYGHFGIEELRSGVDSISLPAKAGIPVGYPQAPPKSDCQGKANINYVIDSIGGRSGTRTPDFLLVRQAL